MCARSHPTACPFLCLALLASLLAIIGPAVADVDRDKDAFVGVDSLQVVVYLDDDSRAILSERRAKSKVELVLRKNRIPVTQTSKVPYLSLDIDAGWQGDEKITCVYTIDMEMLHFGLLLCR